MPKLTTSELNKLFAKNGQRALREKNNLKTEKEISVYFTHLSKRGTQGRKAYWADVKSGKRVRKGQKPPKTLEK